MACTTFTNNGLKTCQLASQHISRLAEKHCARCCTANGSPAPGPGPQEEGQMPRLPGTPVQEVGALACSPHACTG